jgi:hypothetical protein
MKTVREIWKEVETDMAFRKSAGYRKAFIDPDRRLRLILKEKGYPGRNLEQQLFWSGLRTDRDHDLKRAIEKKEEILNSPTYQLSTLELDDFLDAYKRAVEAVAAKKKIGMGEKIYLLFEKKISRNIKKIIQILFCVLLAFLFGVKFLSSTETGRNIISSIVNFNNFLFSWLVNILIIGLAVAIIAGIIFVWLERRRSVKIKESKNDF